MHIANQPAPVDIAHDVFDGIEGQRGIRLVVHGQPDTGHYLQHQHHQCQ